ncbi:MAG: hypothetical protein FWE32_12255 [Oscillospiraceae bacterium]|nr:hypothetical protein [Oscillospiraceae bacterium]
MTSSKQNAFPQSENAFLATAARRCVGGSCMGARRRYLGWREYVRIELT